MAASRPQTLRITERFVSVQGEGMHAGTPSSFIRVAGCNLRCAWCDSPASSWQPAGPRATIEELLAFCQAGPRHVVLTGGEPLLFAPVAELSGALQDRGHVVTVETAGTTWLEQLRCDLMSLSPKLAHSTPSKTSGSWAALHEGRRWNPQVVRALMRFPWQLKFVVRATDEELLQRDVTEIEAMLEDLDVTARDRDRVLLMPECTDRDRLPRDYEALVPVCRQRGFRLGLRLHISLFGHVPGT